MPPKQQHDIKTTSPAVATNPQAVAAATKALSTGLTNYAQIQQDELEVLKSIYMDELEQIRTGQAAWNVCA